MSDHPKYGERLIDEMRDEHRLVIFDSGRYYSGSGKYYSDEVLDDANVSWWKIDDKTGKLMYSHNAGKRWIEWRSGLRFSPEYVIDKIVRAKLEKEIFGEES